MGLFSMWIPKHIMTRQWISRQFLVLGYLDFDFARKKSQTMFLGQFKAGSFSSSLTGSLIPLWVCCNVLHHEISLKTPSQICFLIYTLLFSYFSNLSLENRWLGLRGARKQIIDLLKMNHLQTQNQGSWLWPWEGTADGWATFRAAGCRIFLLTFSTALLSIYAKKLWRL